MNLSGNSAAKRLMTIALLPQKKKGHIRKHLTIPP
jgi:hypothetical protein